MTPKQIKALRKKFGSREHLAAELEVSSMTVYRWETGRSKPHNIFVKAMRDLEERP